MPSAAIEICDLWMAEADDRDLFFIDLSKIILPVLDWKDAHSVETGNT